MIKRVRSIVLLLGMTVSVVFMSGCGGSEKANIESPAENIKTDESSYDVVVINESKSDDTVKIQEEKTTAIDETNKVTTAPTEMPKNETEKNPEVKEFSFTKDFSLNESINGTIQLKGYKGTDYNTYNVEDVAVELSNGKKTSFKTIEAQEYMWGRYNDYTATESYSEDGGLTVCDINFDGYADIGLQLFIPAYNEPTAYWLYNPNNDEYEFYDIYTCPVELLDNEKGFEDSYRSGQEFITDFYLIDKNGLIYFDKSHTYYMGEEENTEVNFVPEIYKDNLRNICQRIIEEKVFPLTDIKLDREPYEYYYAFENLDDYRSNELIFSLDGIDNLGENVIVYQLDESDNVTVKNVQLDKEKHCVWNLFVSEERYNELIKK